MKYIALVSRRQLAAMLHPAPFVKGAAVQWQPNPTAPMLRGTFLRLHPRTAAFAIVRDASRPTHEAIVSTRLLKAAA